MGLTMRAHAWLGAVTSRVREVRFAANVSSGKFRGRDPSIFDEGGGTHLRLQEPASRGVSQSGLWLWLENRTGRPCQRRKRPFWTVTKRIIDVIISGTALLLLAPLSLSLIGMMKSIKGGDVFSCQRVVGREHREFRLYRFRTADVLCRKGQAGQFSSSTLHVLDRILIRSGMDRLPILFNIFRGDISFVGPRIQASRSYALTSDQSRAPEFYVVSLAMQPGLMGWAQVNDYDAAAPSSGDQLSALCHDVAYVQNSSLRVDLEIVTRSLKRWF
jgi:polysaccharide biosynthesis protein PslA